MKVFVGFPVLVFGMVLFGWISGCSASGPADNNSGAHDGIECAENGSITAKAVLAKPDNNLSPFTVRAKGTAFGSFMADHETVVEANFEGAAEEEYLTERIIRHDFTADDKGNVYLLDPANGKITVYKNHKASRSMVLPYDSFCEFLAVNESGDVFAYDATKKPKIVRYNALGEPVSKQDISSMTAELSWMTANGLPFGIYAEEDNVYVDNNTGTSYPILSSGQPSILESSQQVVKFHIRKGMHLSAEMLNNRQVVLNMEGNMLNKRFAVESDRPILAVLDQYVDNNKNIYQVLVIGEPEDNPIRAQFCVISFTQDGTYRGEVDIPSPHAAVRQPVIVSPEGQIYSIHASEKGIKIIKWKL